MASAKVDPVKVKDACKRGLEHVDVKLSALHHSDRDEKARIRELEEEKAFLTRLSMVATVAIAGATERTSPVMELDERECLFIGRYLAPGRSPTVDVIEL